jgi:hypothetical protein
MNNRIGIFLPALISIIIFRLIWISFKNANTKIIIISMTILSTVFFIIGVSSAKSITNQQQAMLEILNVTDKIISDEDIKSINFLVQDKDKDIAVEWNGRIILDKSVSDCYQFVLKDKKIIPINWDDFKMSTENKYVIATRDIKTEYLLEKYTLYANDNGSFLFKIKK